MAHRDLVSFFKDCDETHLSVLNYSRNPIRGRNSKMKPGPEKKNKRVVRVLNATLMDAKIN